MASLFVSKARKVKFEATCVVHDLTNLPYVSGLYYVKWKLKMKEGSSQKCTVKDHTVTFDTPIPLQPTLIIGKDGVLLPCELILYIRQTGVNAGKGSEDVGRVVVNLAEFGAERERTRRYLLQDSRVNSILRITVKMQLVKGDPTYKVPETTLRDLSSEGLRGVFSDQASDSDQGALDSPHIPHQPNPHATLSGTLGTSLNLSIPGLGTPDSATDPNVDIVNRLFATSAQATRSAVHAEGGTPAGLRPGTNAASRLST
ncbi:N-terminal C2 in EEIG1 and EHBP1 proteins-domain-containing protein [Fimicolochytrium jonesii]|uniref:N-terminal C2 in EEIG1 and EHBP1 proteins-domain-containing protein n=1 Tax=Fimicolochytrium jonesii TaxID=1396493 RepID=UPI0022FDC2A6|nr:N-terminal C2 in EEIG1 and EHBP1 proteins-domain-containing protein [Fimicolochytrium jonesii]KAI8826660.1 N-terminal C2 in EEIG1 and EHBP1 proteins-domain-containing protein [Fimicolochytrium jonesii]